MQRPIYEMLLSEKLQESSNCIQQKEHNGLYTLIKFILRHLDAIHLMIYLSLK